MPYVLTIHEVQDYAVWKAIFDKVAGIRKAAGEISYQLLKYETDANNVVHFSRWTTLDASLSLPSLLRSAAMRA
jgi:hypothetical protein